jgi:predicted MFS family arabinose efflux permease
MNCELGEYKHKNDVILIKKLSQILLMRYNFFENDVNRLLYNYYKMQLQTCLYIILFDLVAISDSVYTALLPYFSPVATEKGFTETEIGIMLAFYPIGSVVAAPLVSACKSKRRAMLIGLVLSTVATLGIGLSKFFDGTLFYVFSSLSRFVIGIVTLY